MGGFFLVKGTPAERAAKVPRLERSMSDQGLNCVLEMDEEHFALRVYSKICVETHNYAFQNDGFAFATGTLIYNDQKGPAALRSILNGFPVDDPPYSQLHGHYCLGVMTDGCMRLIVDPLGIYKVFHDADHQVISSSFLTVAESVEQRTINAQSVYEYVFEGAVYGGSSPLNEVRSLDPYTVVTISRGVSVYTRRRPAWNDVSHDSIESHLERQLGQLRPWFQTLKRCFSDNMTMGLSGGRDSRLMLALLHEQRVSPDVYTYGKADDIDVQIARSMGDGEGFDVDWIDRSNAKPIPPEQFAEITRSNFLNFDGYPVRGIYDNGTDLSTRRTRSSNGQLMLNAMAAEIYRLTYEYSDVLLSLDGLLDRYFSSFDPAACGDLFSEDAYFENLRDTIQRVSPHPSELLSSVDTEHIYVDLRCRFWGATNTSINNRFSWALTPFLHLPVVEQAVTLPYRYRVSGLFLGRLIRETSPRLAAYKSEYGHDFSRDPTLHRRLRDSSLYLRKAYAPWVNSFRIKNRIARFRRPAKPRYLSDRYLQEVLNTDFPVMSDFFNVSRMINSDQLARMATLEYLFERFDAAPTAHAAVSSYLGATHD